ITNSKDVRKLRQVLRDPVARDHFLSDGSIESALLRLGPDVPRKRGGLVGDVQALAQSIESYPWTDLASLRGDEDAVSAIEEAENLSENNKLENKKGRAVHPGLFPFRGRFLMFSDRRVGLPGRTGRGFPRRPSLMRLRSATGYS